MDGCDDAVAWRRDRELHLHGFHYGQRLTLFDGSSWLHIDEADNALDRCDDGIAKCWSRLDAATFQRCVFADGELDRTPVQMDRDDCAILPSMR